MVTTYIKRQSKDNILVTLACLTYILEKNDFLHLFT